MSYFLAIEYNVSPVLTVYVFEYNGDSSSISSVGNFSCCPIDKLFDVRLFNSFILFTVVLLAFAILHKESPFFTV